MAAKILKLEINSSCCRGPAAPQHCAEARPVRGNTRHKAGFLCGRATLVLRSQRDTFRRCVILECRGEANRCSLAFRRGLDVQFGRTECHAVLHSIGVPLPPRLVRFCIQDIVRNVSSHQFGGPRMCPSACCRLCTPLRNDWVGGCCLSAMFKCTPYSIPQKTTAHKMAIKSRPRNSPSCWQWPWHFPSRSTVEAALAPRPAHVQLM